MPVYRRHYVFIRPVQYYRMKAQVQLPAGEDDRIFFFATESTPILGPTQPHTQWLPGALASGVKRPEHEADHRPPSSAEVKNAWSYKSITSTLLHGAVLN
jgi:hypothetical protein